MKAKRAKEGDWALAKRIQFCRNLQGASQARIAEVAGIERTAYAKIESGLRTVSAMELDKIAKALWVDMGDLLSPQEIESAIPVVMACGGCDGSKEEVEDFVYAHDRECECPQCVALFDAVGPVYEREACE